MHACTRLALLFYVHISIIIVNKVFYQQTPAPGRGDLVALEKKPSSKVRLVQCGTHTVQVNNTFSAA